jgi:hypothetical protein
MYVIKYLRIEADNYSNATYTLITFRGLHFKEKFCVDGNTVYFIALFCQFSVAFNTTVCQLTKAMFFSLSLSLRNSH